MFACFLDQDCIKLECLQTYCFWMHKSSPFWVGLGGMWCIIKLRNQLLEEINTHWIGLDKIFVPWYEQRPRHMKDYGKMFWPMLTCHITMMTKFAIDRILPKIFSSKDKYLSSTMQWQKNQISVGMVMNPTHLSKFSCRRQTSHIS